MDYLVQGGYSLLCIIGFSVIYNLPRKLILTAGISGMLGWMLHVFLQKAPVSFIVPAFMGAILVGFLGEFAAVWHRQPASIFIIPGIIPFVPGYGIYYTMLHVINDDFGNAAQVGMESMFVAISIACGVVISTSVMRIVKPGVDRQFSAIKKALAKRREA